jgi:hypothetical protein
MYPDCNGLPRKAGQNNVTCTYCLLYSNVKILAGQQVLFVKPWRKSVAPKISVQPLDRRLIVRGVAQESLQSILGSAIQIKSPHRVPCKMAYKGILPHQPSSRERFLSLYASPASLFRALQEYGNHPPRRSHRHRLLPEL